MFKNKILLLTILILFSFNINPVFANDLNTSAEQYQFHSNLPIMTENHLGDIINDVDDIKLNFNKSASRVANMASSSSQYTKEKSDILSIVSDYNKYLFMSFLGKNVLLPENLSKNKDLLDELNARQAYYSRHYSDVKHTSYDFKINIIDLAIDGDVAKAIIKRDVIFQRDLNDGSGNPNIVDTLFSQQEGYVFQKEDNYWYLANVLFDTDSFGQKVIDDLLNSQSSDEWISSYSFSVLPREKYEGCNFLDEQYEDENLVTFKEGSLNESELAQAELDTLLKEAGSRTISSRSTVMYSKQKAGDYASKYGSSPNRNFKYFSRLPFGFLGRDCTNFASQAIRDGGLPDTAGWYYNNDSSYSKSWISVVHLRDYLINNGLALGYYQSLPSYPPGVNEYGTLIQYSNGEEWVHSAIIIKKSKDGIYVAEHSGPNNDQSYVKHGDNLKNKRTFWIGKG